MLQRDADTRELAEQQAASRQKLGPFGANNFKSLDRQQQQQQPRPSQLNMGLAACQQDGDSQENQNGIGNSSNANNNRTTDTQTMMHILKANIGTGVLAMPKAFRHVGLWLGLCLVPLIGAICIHCMNILIASHNRLCDRFNYESLDYDQVAALGLACGPKPMRRLAKWANVFVTVFLMFTQIGFCCVYTLFAAENIQLAMFNLFQLDYSTGTYLLATFPVIGLASCTSNLKHLARITTLANVLQSAGLALIFYDLLQFNTYNSRQYGTASAGPSNATVQVEQGLAADLAAGLPLFFATAVYAFEGIGVVLPLVKEMEEPGRISGPSGVLNSSMSLVALLYMATGFFGYAKYGQHVAGSITLNLPETTLNELVRLCFAVAIGLSYSLQFYVPWTIVWPLIDETLFYSYRPRPPRDKLDILSRLSSDNEWALAGQVDSEFADSELEETRLRPGAGSGHRSDSDQANNNHGNSNNYTNYDQHSNASTYATSYAMSLVVTTSGPFGHRCQQQQQQSLTRSRPLMGQYGTIVESAGAGRWPAAATPATTPTLAGQKGAAVAAKRERQPRNRLDDVTERDSDADELPEVQWRPPPRSMRGKRKLVRYTVILLTVAFTFVAAALIPRLDLFISLIGALASSCLAIIFPAIIQMCTFWNYDQDQADEDQDQDQELDQDEDSDEVGASQAKRSYSSDSLLANSRTGARRRRRSRRRRFWWCLFAIKNTFLVLFGLVGLVTGSWVSLSQLGVTGTT